MPQQNQHFNPVTVSLVGSNLIEASAGTGKTYSIALLSLRLIIEKNIPVQQILMVTFTKAAVAELELRVRAFVRLAVKVCEKNEIQDGTITQLVHTSINTLGFNTVYERLLQAQLFLDETAVLTIHSFCQKVMNEFAFESGVPFGSTALTPDEVNALIENSFFDFWRLHITTLPTELLQFLLQIGLHQQQLFNQVTSALQGKISIAALSFPADFLSETQIETWWTQIETENDKLIQQKAALIQYLQQHQSQIITQIQAAKTNAIKAFAEDAEQGNWEAILDTIIAKYDKNYVAKIFNGFEEEVKQFRKAESDFHLAQQQQLLYIGIKATDFVKAHLANYKRKNAAITFDDMINEVHRAVTDPTNAPLLIEALQQKYKAVFIDEFQDTDDKQYTIFKTLFAHSGHLLFYIGDPKQSIYGFRSADIFTYFKASQEVDQIHLMNTNHRSSEGFIAAMNHFFVPTTPFDTFRCAEIQYIPVQSPQPNAKGQLLQNGLPATPIRIAKVPNKGLIYENVVTVVRQLLHTTQYAIEKNNIAATIKPSDIGILVRSRREGTAIKQQLAQYGIPAVTISDSKLLDTPEAAALYYIMVAAWQVNRPNINRALLTHLGNYTTAQLLQSNEEDLLQLFRHYQETWNTQGVYVMLRKFLADHHFIQQLQQNERLVSNVFQLIEIIHKTAQRKKFSPEEQVIWLKKAIEGHTAEGDEYEQRIESDEDTVKIVTIHKSKGLEYNIVIAPFLDMEALPRNADTISFRHPESGLYYYAPINQALEEQYNWAVQQAEQENRRLLYVAITRAKYHCYITHAENNKNSTLKAFIQAFDECGLPADLMAYYEPAEADMDMPTTQSATNIERTYAEVGNLTILHPHWQKASYTMLSPEHEPVPTQRFTEPINNYDAFVFRDLKKGAHTGNLLHYLLEYIDFSQPEQWPSIVERGIKRLSGSNSQHADFQQHLLMLLQQVCTVDLPSMGFSLSNIKRSDCITELEFNFPLRLHHPQSIEALSTPTIPLAVKNMQQLEGMMNGKIDLFFEYHNKFYIIDWKSNYLGPSIDAYQTDALAAAMMQNNYHLQYHLYTLAVCKYLKYRNPRFNYRQHFGGVAYFFLRGIRTNESTGIFFHQPLPNTLQQLHRLLCGEKLNLFE